MGFGLLFMAVPLGIFLNWLAVSVVLLVLGLRRRRWRTPGFGTALWAAGLTAAVPLSLVAAVVFVIVAETTNLNPELEEPLAVLFALHLSVCWLAGQAALARSWWVAATPPPLDPLDPPLPGKGA